MSEIRELSFCELRRKDIVSINDGRKLGRIIDLVFSPSGRVQGIVAPYGRKFLFFQSQEVYIPYSNIKTIGEDIILVDIDTGLCGRAPGNRRIDEHIEDNYKACAKKYIPPEKCRTESDKDGCDGRCDKCMLFDCENRWKKQNAVYIDNAPYK